MIMLMSNVKVLIANFGFGVTGECLSAVCSPGTKLAQAKKFNDPEDPCKILIATDAIGMGLNL